MIEDIAQMVPLLLVAGGLAGWSAEAISRAGGYGLLTDMAIGVVGSLAVGAMVWTLISPGAGMLAMSLMGCAGASVAIVAQRSLRRSVRSGE